VLCEHGGWGAEASAPVAAKVINAFVTKQRKRDNNLRIAATPQPATPQPAPATSSTTKPSAPTAE